MPAIDDMVAKVRGALSVAASYDPVLLQAVNGAIERILRDYNFDRSIKLQKSLDLAVGADNVDVPSGLKRPLMVRFHQLDGTGAHLYSERLDRATGFVLPPQGQDPTHYWLMDGKLYWNLATPEAGLDLFFWYQSRDVTTNQDWVLADFNDAIFYLSVIRAAPLVKKAEILSTYTPLWADERSSLAIFTHELEFNDVVMYQREAAPRRGERYPSALE